LFYIPTWENSSSTYSIGVAPPEFHAGQTFAGNFPRGGPRGEDTYSAIRAIDPKTGEKKWDFRMPNPRTEAGVLTTASDVLFSGGVDGAFYALDARDGKQLWKTNLGPSVMAGPMTYSVEGKQYVSIMSGNSLFTFGLR
jgi:outer membrane protein assembly factor BamB